MPVEVDSGCVEAPWERTGRGLVTGNMFIPRTHEREEKIIELQRNEREFLKWSGDHG